MTGQIAIYIIDSSKQQFFSRRGIILLRWLSSFLDIISGGKLAYTCWEQLTKGCLLRNSMTLVMTEGKGAKMVDR
ncbi:unknown protein [Microcystis aeruginosa NIES-843]|uniref:Uncharacterized protein n=1 Tax=Microcystis aeruginosa (strain NIES-843 / IAM M-2473) TaxID=449447 RepID=B0JTT1_MICAN|nr:unknown protein [Microcystis aeruginosa NIES-843]